MEEKVLSTKEKILVESMKLFSVQGFEAVSVRAIAAAVGVRDSALYKHFPSKQAIFDAIVENSKERFWEQYKKMHLDQPETIDLVEMCLKMFRFQTQDEWIVRFRQMLVIEQFKNPDIAKVYKELFIDMPVENQSKIFEKFIEAGVMKGSDPVVMSMELYAPFFLYHTVQDKPIELEQRLRQHVQNFKENYFIDYQED